MEQIFTIIIRSLCLKQINQALLKATNKRLIKNLLIF